MHARTRVTGCELRGLGFGVCLRRAARVFQDSGFEDAPTAVEACHEPGYRGRELPKEAWESILDGAAPCSSLSHTL